MYAFIGDECSDDYETARGFIDPLARPAQAVPEPGPSKNSTLPPDRDLTSRSKTTVQLSASQEFSLDSPATRPHATTSNTRKGKRRPRMSAAAALPDFTEQLDAVMDESMIGIGALEDMDLPEFTPFVLPAGSYYIELVLDEREDRGGSSQKRKRGSSDSDSDDDGGGRQVYDQILTGLMELGVSAKRTTLKLGDVLWVAKRIQPRGDEYDEIVLDFIAERKRLDDLVFSIAGRNGRDKRKKSRYHDQKVGGVLHGSLLC